MPRAIQAAPEPVESPASPAPLPTSAIRSSRNVRQDRQAIEQMPDQHRFRLAYGGEIVHVVPLLDEREVLQQAALGFLRNCESEGGDSVSKTRRQAHALCFFSGREKPRFTCTSNKEMAAGVMPEIRAAWPAVSGLN